MDVCSKTLDRLQKPQLQVWRKEPNAFLDTLILVHSSNASPEPTSRNNLGIFEYVLNEPAHVKSGDILGFYQLGREESQLQLAFVSNTEPVVYELLLIQSEPFLLAENRSSAINTSSPMISVEILPGIIYSCILATYIHTSGVIYYACIYSYTCSNGKILFFS